VENFKDAVHKSVRLFRRKSDLSAERVNAFTA
jgi:hypothetical protein